MLDQAFEALKTYDWGTDVKVLDPISDAVISSHSDAAARAQLESRLADVLKSSVSRDAKDYVCRKLMLIGAAPSVPALAALLPDAEHSHMARYALERIQAPEAAAALRDALPKVSNSLKVGVIGSLGARGDVASVPAISALLADADAAVARAAAIALGDIGGVDAAKALTASKPSTAEVKSATTDASLACAEDLLASGAKMEALMVFKSLAGEDQPKHIRLAGTRGMLACAGKKSE
jgi:HEAT repeat protein